MSKQVLFRVDDNILIAFDKKLSDKGISKQFFFNKCVELFVNGSLSFDSNELANDSSNNDIADLKKQMAIVLERLSKLENDSNVITNDKQLIEVENIELKSVDNTFSSVKEDVTVKNTPSESLIIDVNEVLREKVPNEHNEGNLGDELSNNYESVVLDGADTQSDTHSEINVSSDDELSIVESFPVEQGSVLDNTMAIGEDSLTENSIGTAKNNDVSNIIIGTLKDAIDNVIFPELAKGEKSKSLTEIAKLLQGKYNSSLHGHSTNWQSSLVSRAIKYREEGKV